MAQKRFSRTQVTGDLFGGFKGPGTMVPATMPASEISAPATTFLAGLSQSLGYNVEADRNRLEVAFEPWSLESDQPFDVPVLRLRFRHQGDRVVLERFTISDEGEERTVELGAAQDALQAWMDYIAG